MNDSDEIRCDESDSDSDNGNESSIEEEEEESHHQEPEERVRRREFMGAMDVIPFDMDFNDGCVLLSLLYTIRKQMGGVYRNWALSQFWYFLLAKIKITRKILMEES